MTKNEGYRSKKCRPNDNLLPCVTHDLERSPSVPDAIAIMRLLNARAGRRRPVAVDRPLVLYGAGDLGKFARKHLDIVGVPIALVVDVDADVHRHDPEWRGLDIVAPSEVPAAIKRDGLLAVSIVNHRFSLLETELASAGWSRRVPFYDIAEGFRAAHPLSNGWFSDVLDVAHLTLCEQTLQGWADDISLAHYIRFAAWRLCREDWHFADAPVVPSNRFFIPEILDILTANERVLDAGAYHGTYLARFLDTRGVLSAAWAIEPDAGNRAILADWVETLAPRLRERVSVYDEVIGARSETVLFHEGLGYASQVAPSGRRCRETRCIDEINLDPTVIKLHLEGDELAALKGARETILRHRPIIMATIYHNDDGLARTSIWLMQNLYDYLFYLRGHSWCGTGLVVYAIPKERQKQ